VKIFQQLTSKSSDHDMMKYASDTDEDDQSLVSQLRDDSDDSDEESESSGDETVDNRFWDFVKKMGDSVTEGEDEPQGGDAGATAVSFRLFYQTVKKLGSHDFPAGGG
jgi:hypothetical protein